MSLPDSTDAANTGAAGVFVRKPKSDIYTVLLAISLAAILIAILCLGLELRANSKDRTSSIAPSSSYACNTNVLTEDPTGMPLLTSDDLFVRGSRV